MLLLYTSYSVHISIIYTHISIETILKTINSHINYIILYIYIYVYTLYNLIVPIYVPIVKPPGLLFFFQAPGEAPWLPRGALGSRSRPGAAGRFGLRGALRRRRRHGAATGGVSGGGAAGGAKGQGKDGGSPAVLHGAGDDLLPLMILIEVWDIYGIFMGYLGLGWRKLIGTWGGCGIKHCDFLKIRCTCAHRDWSVSFSEAKLQGLDSLPLSQSGKVDRAKLKSIWSNRRALESTSERGASGEPVTEMQRHVVQAFQEALGLESLGIFDNFFELGGHSLSAIGLQNALISRGISVTLQEVFRAQTPEQIAKMFDKGAQEQVWILGWVKHAQPPKVDGSLLQKKDARFIATFGWWVVLQQIWALEPRKWFGITTQSDSCKNSPGLGIVWFCFIDFYWEINRWSMMIQRDNNSYQP